MNLPSNQNTSLISRYRALTDSGAIIADAEQSLVVEALNLLVTRLEREPKRETRGGFARAIFGWGREATLTEALRGLYIYGRVGRGKSMLMQLFVEQLPDKTHRVHFHEFMQWVHAQLARLRGGKMADPIEAVADLIATRAQVLCLDEMQVENIADAMIIGRLFDKIFDRGVVLVTTANRHPDRLYENGLNRNRFVPFIELIKAQCEIIDLAGDRDYRFEGLAADDRYFIDDRAGFDAAWMRAAPKPAPFDFAVSGRRWRLDGYHNRIGRTRFAEACETARGAADYAALVTHLDGLFLAEIPILDAPRTSAITRFVTLIDILYEARTKLFLDLPVPLSAVHSDPKTEFVFARTLSRLVELSR